MHKVQQHQDDGAPRRFEVALADDAFDRPATPSNNNGRLLKVEEAAAFVGVHPNTVYNAAKEGHLRSHRVGRLRRFTVEDLLEWTEARR